MTLLRLAIASLRSRALTVGLTIFAMALSVALFLSIGATRDSARDSFADTISGTDLIMGARSGGVQLLLYSVFRIGNATNNITWDSYQDIAARPEVAWSVPISLGDSHRQFRVMGTTTGYFEHYRYRGDQSLSLQGGALMEDLFDAVIGADVARTLGYAVGDPIVVAHGLASFVEHADTPFRIAGILEKTGTPVDRTVIVSLEAIEAIHVDWQGGAQRPGQPTPVDDLRAMDLTPQAVTAVLIGVESRLQIFALQRAINDYPLEPLLAVLPGIALQELWSVVGVAETALIAISLLVVITALLGMAAMLLSSLEARRREMAILRAMGAGPRAILGLLMVEAMVMALIASVLGFGLMYLGLAVLQPVVDSRYGLFLALPVPELRDLVVPVVVTATAALVSLVPAIRAYQMSLADGMLVKM